MAKSKTRKTNEVKVYKLKRPDIKHRIKKSDMPDSWKEKIKGPDGKCRKVVLYHTGLSVLLEKPEITLDKMESVLKLFKDNKDNIVVWWRPHPLARITLKDMHPEYLDRYESIVKRYIDEDYGIYDDSMDADRAADVADAYYGDSSQLVWKCFKQEIPVMIGNVEVKVSE